LIHFYKRQRLSMMNIPEDIHQPMLWRRPVPKIYDYNRQSGSSYYQPMIEYIDTKDRQGIFFERPSERIHLPSPSELVMKEKEPELNGLSGPSRLNTFLVKAFSQQAKEINGSTARASNLLLRSSAETTTLSPKLTSAMLRDHYIKEIHLSKVRGDY